jgi:hypothetical protein
MIHRDTPRSRVAKRVAATVLASAFIVVGSPVAASSAASGGGAHRAVSATFGDCKNDNSGKHNGYDCPTDSGSGTSGGGILVF